MIKYYPETDTLHITLSDGISTATDEVFENVLFNFNSEGKVISITIDPAGDLVDIAELRFKAVYQPEHDLLNITLTEKPSTETREVIENVVFDFDASGKIVKIEIEHASEMVDIEAMELM